MPKAQTEILGNNSLCPDPVGGEMAMCMGNI